MTKILIVSPDRKWLSRECQESDVVRTLLDYTIDNNISVNRKIRDAHKLLLDISRSGALVIVFTRIEKVSMLVKLLMKISMQHI